MFFSNALVNRARVLFDAENLRTHAPLPPTHTHVHMHTHKQTTWM